MKTVIIGDLHGIPDWHPILEFEKPGRCVFVGDYFDSFDVSAAEQIFNFKRIIEWKESNPGTEVILLIGNHDYHYFAGMPHGDTTGFQANAYHTIQYAIEENRHHMRMAYQFDNIICSHAGIGLTWLEMNGWDGNQPIVKYVNDLWRYKPGSFDHRGYHPSGDSMGETPIWIRPRSLMKDWSPEYRDAFVQVVGHTTRSSIDMQGKSTGGRFYFIDTMQTSGEYLVVEDGSIRSNSLRA
jgi:hypothetical protein